MIIRAVPGTICMVLVSFIPLKLGDLHWEQALKDPSSERREVLPRKKHDPKRLQSVPGTCSGSKSLFDVRVE